MTIKHLVLSGGSYKGFIMIGIIKKLIENKYIIINEIETFWATSIGTLISVMLSLKIDLIKLIEFVENVPINNYTNINFNTLMEIYQNSGFLDEKIFLGFLKSPFYAEDLNINTVTLKEFYDYSGKEINFFCVNYNTVEKICFNYKSHPNIKLIDVIYCSCSIPMIFKPKKINDIVYLDGGLKVHYPSKECLSKHNNNEIFGIYSKTSNVDETDFTNIIVFISKLINKIIFLKQRENFEVLENEIKILRKASNFSKILTVLSDRNERIKLINEGYKKADEYFKKTK